MTRTTYGLNYYPRMRDPYTVRADFSYYFINAALYLMTNSGYFPIDDVIARVLAIKMSKRKQNFSVSDALSIILADEDSDNENIDFGHDDDTSYSDNGTDSDEVDTGTTSTSSATDARLDLM